MLEQVRTVKLIVGWKGKQMFMVDQTSKVHMEHTLGNLLVQHAWRERKPLYGLMNMLYDHNYVAQATVPFHFLTIALTSMPANPPTSTVSMSSISA